MSSGLFPKGSCDTHIHFYDHRFPSAPQAVLRPPDASVTSYRRFQEEMELERVVVVQPTTYDFDNRCQLEAMKALGDSARGVMVVGSTVTEAELEGMTAAGARGARFHMLPGGAVPWEALADVAARVGSWGWHIQLQLNGRELESRLGQLLRLRGTLVIDHVGRFMPPVGIDDPNFAALLTLLETGRCWVKLSAPYESSVTGPPEYSDVAVLAKALIQQIPERMLWASNWPHPGQADPPTPELLRDLLVTWAGDAAILRRVLVENPAELYGF